MVKGYCGYYKGTYLRSQLEFTFAYYLDFKGIQWMYEPEVFDLGDCRYKPDFAILDKKGDITEYIEIKGEGNLQEGIIKTQQFSEVTGLSIRLVTNKDLMTIYQREMPCSLTSAKRVWQTEFGAKLNVQDLHGANNPMYGLTHRDETKKKIGISSTQRFKNPEMLSKISEAIKKHYRDNGTDKLKQTRTKREIRQCLYCGKKFEDLVTRTKQYCSVKCACIARGSDARLVLQDNRVQQRKGIKQLTLQWCTEHSELILNMSFNAIEKNFKPLMGMVEQKFGFKDFRIVVLAVMGVKMNRKKLLTYLKDYVYKNVC